jgi:hypothetical protein
MTRILLDKGITDFKWNNCMGSNELYFRIGYYDKFFLEGGLENVFEEHELEDEDCGILYSYYLKEIENEFNT